MTTSKPRSKTRRDFLKSGAAVGMLAARHAVPGAAVLVSAAALAPRDAAAQSVPPPVPQYADALQKAIYFYQFQRSGPLPAARALWRGPSCLNDGQDIGRDLSGGYFDAGDHVKFGLPMAATLTMLCWSLHESRSAYVTAALEGQIRDAIRWGTDYLIKCHTATHEFVYQVGSGSADHGWWGPPESVETVMARPSYRVTMASPGSTVVAAAAAALAAASVVLADDTAYAATCLAHARELYAFADATRSDAGYIAARGFYDTYTGFWDELACAATWLHIATSGGAGYLAAAEAAAINWGKEGRNGTVWSYKWTMSWDDMHYMTQILLARLTGKSIYIDSVERNLDFMLPGGGVITTPGGLAWVDKWGSLRYAANAAFLALVWADEGRGNAAKKSLYRDFATRQIGYILGQNPRGISYLIGYGSAWPRKPHHRGAHGTWINDIKLPADSAHVLVGALVGGPDSTDAYVDDRSNYVANEVACDYNAGLVGALAKLAGHIGQSPPGFDPASFEPAAAARRPEVFSRARLVSESTTSSQILVQLSNRSAWPATVRRNLSCRYYFDTSETNGAKVTATLGQNEGATLTGPFTYSGTVQYVELSFGSTPIHPAGREQCERMATFTLSAPTWNPTNDFSRSGIVTSPFTYEPEDLTGLTLRIPVFENGLPIAGELPSATPVPLTTIKVAAQSLAFASAGGGSTVATATAKVTDSSDLPVSGATVSGRVSFSTTVFSATTDAAGLAQVKSAKFRGTAGATYSFTVSGVAKAGTTLDTGGSTLTFSSKL